MCQCCFPISWGSTGSSVDFMASGVLQLCMNFVEEAAVTDSAVLAAKQLPACLHQYTFQLLCISKLHQRNDFKDNAH